jgi:hypothetical protein
MYAPKGSKAEATWQDLELGSFVGIFITTRWGTSRRSEPRGRILGLRDSGNGSDMDRKDENPKAR